MLVRRNLASFVSAVDQLNPPEHGSTFMAADLWKGMMQADNRGSRRLLQGQRLDLELVACGTAK